jgi:topoisomerase-4 subunit A
MTRAKKPAPPSKSALIEDQNLLDYTIGAMTYYGKHTIQNRALPDFRDGLIPVQRRLLWAAFKMGSRDAELVKSARIIGDTIGRYHPHGDSAAYTALITLVQSPTKLVLGSGNWGSFDDPKSAAAMRYTEARLSAFARKCFFDPYQIRATDLISNFDGTATEPVVLHSNLPVAMLLGGTGIAVGVTYGMPSYTPQSVAKLTAMALSGKTITPRMCVEHLEFMFRWGGHVHPDHYKDGTLAELYKTGQATLYVVSDHAYENKRLVISGVAPGVNVAKAMESSAEYEALMPFVHLSME